MGEVVRPESLIRRKPIPESQDIPNIPGPSLPAPTSLESLYQEIQIIRTEIAKIKQAMKAHGISVE